MASWSALCRAGLALVLLVASFTKLADRVGTARAAADLGVPGRLTGPVSVVLPLVELTLAAGLLVPPVAGVAGGLTAVLFAVFTAVVVRTLAAGDRPDCHCFGALGRSRIGWPTVGRTLVLVGVSVVAALGGGRGADPVARVADASPPTLALWSLAGLVAAAVFVMTATGLAGDARRTDQPSGSSASARARAASRSRPDSSR